MKKHIQVFSDGSANFCFNTKEKQKFKIYEKDERNFSLNKKKNFNTVTHSNSSLNYKNQYLV